MILSELSNAFGPSGCEAGVRKVLREALADHVDDIRVDALGNLIAHQRGTGDSDAKIMVTAHMDEVGFMVTHADDQGLIHFVKVGGIVDGVLPAKAVTIGDDHVVGVLAMKPVHLNTPDERKRIPKADQLVIDIGVSAKGDAEKHAAKGTYAVFATEFEDAGEVVTGKAFDDRAGCAVLVDLLQAGRRPYDVYGVFTTMEEVGGRGAKVAACGIDPDAVFVLEGTICDDSPKDRDESPTTAMGRGPALSVMDRTLIVDPRLVQYILAKAEENGIPWQYKQPGMGSTDGGPIHMVREGMPTAVVSVPCRYIHSPTAMLSKQDYKNTVELMDAVLKDFSHELVADR